MRAPTLSVARLSPPVEAVEATFPALRELGAYKVRIAATEDGRSSVYAWDVDGCMVTLRRGHGPSQCGGAVVIYMPGLG